MQITKLATDGDMKSLDQVTEKLSAKGIQTTVVTHPGYTAKRL